MIKINFHFVITIMIIYIDKIPTAQDPFSNNDKIKSKRNVFFDE